VRAQIYDATADFEAGWVAGNNPNGVWSYGWTNGIAGPLTLFTRNHIPIVNNNLEHMWDDPNNSFGFTPSVARNTGGDFDDGNVTFTAGALILHPSGIDGQAYAHVIWTAPENGIYALESTFFAQQNNINVDVHILVSGVSVFDDAITSNGVSRAFSGDFTLSVGDTIDFTVGPNGDFVLHPGNTGLDAMIRKTDVGGSVTGMSPRTGKVTCRNLTTKKTVRITIPDGVRSWDCEQAGLVVNPGDKIKQTMMVTGPAD
jgi:hypothetical protein